MQEEDQGQTGEDVVRDGLNQVGGGVGKDGATDPIRTPGDSEPVEGEVDSDAGDGDGDED